MYRCLFEPEQLAGRRSVTFRVSGEQVYWLSGLQPKLLLKQQAEKLVPNIEHVKEEEPKKRGGKSAPKERKVLVFDEEGKLDVMRFSKDVASMTNWLYSGVIRRRLFGYWWKVLGFDITDFMTASQYDELCKRKSD